MDKKLMVALLDFRVALGELKACLEDIDKAIQALIAIELDIKREK